MVPIVSRLLESRDTDDTIDFCKSVPVAVPVLSQFWPENEAPSAIDWSCARSEVMVCWILDLSTLAPVAVVS